MNEQVNRNRQGLVCGKTENSPGLEPPVKIKNNLNPTNSPGEVTRLGTPVEDNEEPEGCRRRLLQKSFLVQNSNESDMKIMQGTSSILLFEMTRHLVIKNLCTLNFV